MRLWERSIGSLMGSIGRGGRRWDWKGVMRRFGRVWSLFLSRVMRGLVVGRLKGGGVGEVRRGRVMRLGL